MIDFTKYRTQNFLQILKSNPKYKRAVANSNSWQEVVDVIDSLDVKYTQEQLEYVKQKDWSE